MEQYFRTMNKQQWTEFVEKFEKFSPKEQFYLRMICEYKTKICTYPSNRCNSSRDSCFDFHNDKEKRRLISIFANNEKDISICYCKKESCTKFHSNFEKNFNFYRYKDGNGKCNKTCMGEKCAFIDDDDLSFVTYKIEDAKKYLEIRIFSEPEETESEQKEEIKSEPKKKKKHKSKKEKISNTKIKSEKALETDLNNDFRKHLLKNTEIKSEKVLETDFLNEDFEKKKFDEPLCGNYIY